MERCPRVGRSRWARELLRFLVVSSSNPVPPTSWTMHLTPCAPSKHPSTHAPTVGGGLPPPSQVSGDSEMARLLVPSQCCFLAF